MMVMHRVGSKMCSFSVVTDDFVDWVWGRVMALHLANIYVNVAAGTLRIIRLRSYFNFRGCWKS
jgi:hypothetical protein